MVFFLGARARVGVLVRHPQCAVARAGRASDLRQAHRDTPRAAERLISRDSVAEKAAIKVNASAAYSTLSDRDRGDDQ